MIIDRRVATLKEENYTVAKHTHRSPTTQNILIAPPPSCYRPIRFRVAAKAHTTA